jgi:hypothetical protein
VPLGTDPLNADTDGDGLNDLKDPKPLQAANPIAQRGKAGATTVQHLDAAGSPSAAADSSRFRANPNALPYKSQNAKTLRVQIASKGYAPSTLSIKKDAGGAEKAD